MSQTITTTKRYAVYSPDGDMTFIMEDTFDAAGEPLSTEVIGFHFGEPYEGSVEEFVGNLKAEFLM